MGREGELRQDVHGDHPLQLPRGTLTGVSSKAWPKVRAEGHADQVVAALREAGAR